MTTPFLSSAAHFQPVHTDLLDQAEVPRAPFILHEYFAGGGMARLGFGAGWACAFANEICPAKAAVYADNFGTNELRVCGVETLDVTDVPGRADAAWASFPCTDLSLAGRGAGIDAPRSGSVWAFLSLVDRLKAEGRGPRTICFENVTGMLSPKHLDGFLRLVQRLVSSGYSVGAVQIPASLWVPQSRDRLFLLAFDGGLPPSLRGSVSPVWHPERLRDAVARLPAAVAAGWSWLSLPAPAQPAPLLGSVIDESSATIRWDSPEKTARLIAGMSRIDREFVEHAMRLDARQHYTINRRTREVHGCKRVMSEVNKSGLAGCLRTAKGGSSRQILLEIGGNGLRTRLLSAPESARLMGLPEGYRLPARLNAALNVTGDGVVVPVVRHLVQHLIEPWLRHTARPDIGTR